MINETTNGYKDLGINPLASSINQIFVVKHSAGTFSGKLIEIRGKKMLFETRGGRRILIHEDEIRTAIDVTPGRP